MGQPPIFPHPMQPQYTANPSARPAVFLGILPSALGSPILFSPLLSLQGRGAAVGLGEPQPGLQVDIAAAVLLPPLTSLLPQCPDWFGLGMR